MGKSREVLSDDHARALIKQALGMIFGELEIEAEAAAEIAAIEAQHATVQSKLSNVLPLPQAAGTRTPSS